MTTCMFSPCTFDLSLSRLNDGLHVDFCLSFKSSLAPSCTDKDDNALKTKLRRLCEKKANGKLQVPQWLHDEWKSGNKDVMADCLRDCNFDKDTILNILI